MFLDYLFIEQNKKIFVFYDIHDNFYRFQCSSIGFAIAQRFAAEGAKVVVSSRKPQNVEKAVNKLKSDGHFNVLGVKCHVSDANDRKNLFDETIKKFGKIDILVSNAAVNPTVRKLLIFFESSLEKSSWKI